MTFNTPFARYRFLRLPYGVHSASKVFQASVAEIIEGMDSCCNSQDDILIWGKDQHQFIKLRTKFARPASNSTSLNVCLAFVIPW